MKTPEHDKPASDRAHTRARQLRKSATVPERILWGLLRDRSLAGAKFRRQHAVGPFIVDFYSAAYRLVVELDGRSHHDRGHYDAERQRYLESVAGLRGLRIDNDDVLRDRESVLLWLRIAIGVEPD
jgi:very-short-patch-repair endonuclease